MKPIKIEGYLQFDILEIQVSAEGRKYNHFGYHPCREEDTDVFFHNKEVKLDSFNIFGDQGFETALCMDDLTQLRLYGAYGDSILSSIIIGVQYCSGLHCKS